MTTTFAERLKEARSKSGLTQREVCDQVDIVNAQTLSNYENGNAEPKLPTLKKLAELYGVSADWLLNIRPTQNVVKKQLTFGDLWDGIMHLYDLYDPEKIAIKDESTEREVLVNYDSGAIDLEFCPDLAIHICCDEIVRFYRNKKKVWSLVQDGTFDEVFYQSWKKGELQRLMETPISVDDLPLPF